VSKAFYGFVWFLMQSFGGGVVGAFWFCVPLLVVGGILIWAYQRSEPVEYWKLSLLAVLPLIWIFVGLWGGYFWIDWQKRPFVPHPDWVLYPVRFGLWVFLAYALAMIVYLRGVRLAVVLFALINLHFMLTMTLLASMAVTGTWL
jgi:hypothetical protein